jgi:hypothetical protein
MLAPSFVSPAGVLARPVAPSRALTCCPRPRPLRRLRAPRAAATPPPPPPPPPPRSSSFALADLPVVALGAAPARAGAYAVRGPDGALAYVGYSRDVRARLAFHAAAVGDAAAACQVYAPEDARKVSADMLEAVLEYWVGENGGVPEGNLGARAMWEGRAAGVEDAARQQEVLVRSVLTFILFSSALKTAQYLLLPY